MKKKLYIKIVVLNEIYNFGIENFLTKNYVEYEKLFLNSHNLKFKFRISEVI
jgi:hypothetical protein